MLNSEVKVQLFQQPNRITSQTIYQALRLALTKLTSTQAKLQSVIKTYQSLHPEVSQAELENLAEELQVEIQQELTDAPSRLSETVSQVGNDIVYNPSISSSAGQLITWVFIPLVGLSGAMAYERERSTLKRLLTTPTSRLTYFSATIFGQVLIALVQISLLGFWCHGFESSLAQPTFPDLFALAGFFTGFSRIRCFSWQFGQDRKPGFGHQYFSGHDFCLAIRCLVPD